MKKEMQPGVRIILNRSNLAFFLVLGKITNNEPDQVVETWKNR